MALSHKESKPINLELTLDELVDLWVATGDMEWQMERTLKQHRILKTDGTVWNRKTDNPQLIGYLRIHQNMKSIENKLFDIPEFKDWYDSRLEDE